jgi:hypothetical protein
MKALTFGLAALALLSAGPARAAFEDIEVSPRSRAMGGAFSALAVDAFAPFHNPAALAWTGETQAAASYVRPFGYDFSSQWAASAVTRLGKWGGVGIGFRRFGVDYRDESLTGETTVNVSHGFRLMKDLQSQLAVGWAVNLYNLSYGNTIDLESGNPGSGIDPGSATAFGVDLSAQATLYNRTRVGFYVLNVNNPSIGDTDKEDLVQRVGAGVAYVPYQGVTTVLDISNELGEPFQFRGGTEFDVLAFMKLRAGIRTEPSIFTAGVGINHSGISVDYGFSTGGGTLNPTHQFGVSYVLPAGK